MLRPVRLTALALICLASSVTFAGQAVSPAAAGSLKEPRVAAAALKGNLLGDAADVRGYQGMQLAQTLDEQIARGTAREMIVVVPSGRNGYFGGFYANSAVTGKHPDVFSALHALSPCCVALQDDAGSDNPAWVKAMQIPSRDQIPAKPTSFADFYATAFVAVSAALSPKARA